MGERGEESGLEHGGINKESMRGSCLLPCQFENRNAMWYCHMSFKEERVRV